ncbi:MAG: hypothetical protein JSS14_21985 [Proteobacteria bacterium]|nr:hypothetical protein [Pseudomonadota bacterium]
MASLQSLTKDKLIAHIAKLDAQLIAQGRTIEALRMRVAQQPLGHGLSGSVAEHRAYHAYVARCKEQQRGAKVVGYKTFAQWLDVQRAAQQQVDDAYLPGEREYLTREAEQGNGSMPL